MSNQQLVDYIHEQLSSVSTLSASGNVRIFVVYMSIELQLSNIIHNGWNNLMGARTNLMGGIQ